eukprot:752346-Hanusia_phi.AAC.3
MTHPHPECDVLHASPGHNLMTGIIHTLKGGEGELPHVPESGINRVDPASGIFPRPTAFQYYPHPLSYR